jgi:hypothetical protein
MDIRQLRKQQLKRERVDKNGRGASDLPQACLSFRLISKPTGRKPH